MNKNLENKIILITGVEGQLGKSFAEYLIKCNAKVIGLDLKDKSSILHKNYFYVKADITSKDDLTIAANKIKKNFYLPNVLINNAAIDTPPNSNGDDTGFFEDFPSIQLDKVIDVNLKGLIICCQVFGKYMSNNNGGSIINISSIYGMLSPDQSIYDYKRKNGQVFYKPISYSATKGAVFNISRYLAVYWAKKNVRVNTLTFAGVFNNQDEIFLENYCKRIPIGRMANPEDYFGAIFFLSSDMSSYMTGSNLVIDGGWTSI
jgi:NAD(P)-dependent dehydrogenase (short-subunit alcohol dehydrogenase family)